MWCVWAILGCATALSGDDSCDASVAAAPEFPGTTLSWEPRLFIYENFFNDSECDYLKKRTMERSDFDPGEAFHSSYFTERDMKTDPIIAHLENKLATVTGVPSHPDEEPMCIHRILPSQEDYNIDEIHHDKVNKEFSSVTVLVFLEDTEKGGETIWPCPGKDSKGKPIKGQCQTAFDGGARWFNGKKAVVNGKWGMQTEPTAMHSELIELREATHHACGAKLSGQGSNGAMTVAPRKGTAAVFWHDHVSGAADGQAWHTGCRVREGVKWTMQKFKEMPAAHRRVAQARAAQDTLVEQQKAKIEQQKAKIKDLLTPKVVLTVADLTAFYAKHDPAKVDEQKLVKILTQYSSKELIAMLTKKYGESPAKFIGKK